MKRALIRGVGLALSPLRRRLLSAAADPVAAQARVLADVAGRLAACEYGRHLGVTGAGDFRRKVPVVDFDALTPWLERQRATERAVLTPEPVLFYEKTSGSSGAHKHIPYTASLRTSFSRMFAAWAADVIAHGPPLRTGRTYISVSPRFAHDEGATARGVPVGMDSDVDYVDGWLRPVLEPFLVMPRAGRDGEEFKRLTCEALVACADLEIVSVWNPSFFTVLLDWIAEHREGLAARVRQPARRAALTREPVDWRGLWPQLALISCWDSAAAAPLARRLGLRFPGVMVQGKGLLATEAPMTVPIVAAGGQLPVLDEVLLEFLGPDGRLRLCDELADGDEYELVLSQKGGLYRYRIGDRVRVAGRYGAAPLLAFVGRGGDVSDLVGEKLGEGFVHSVLDALCPDAGFRALIATRVPRDGYVLLLDELRGDPAALAARLDRALGSAPHYRHARALGQLAAPLVRTGSDLAEALACFHERRGMKRGDIKPRALERFCADEVLRARLGLETDDERVAS